VGKRELRKETMVEVPGVSGYSEVAARFRDLSESIEFREIHRCILHWVPEAGATVLDVGAGTGRDAAALAAMGHSVVAVEPMDQFLADARAMHRSPKIRWVSGSLPGLQELPPEPDQFDFVLCHAVWQHLRNAERAEAIARVAALLKPKGVFALGLRHGPPGAGTHYFPASAPETVSLAARVNLAVELRLENQPSALPNKTCVNWTRLAFRKTN
jgi:2-polyprenyl-3-methyl-5-hydroxy-6-metoxy-1,4-benzoquinol methylase